MAVQFYISTNNAQSFQFFYTLTNIFYSPLKNSCYDIYEP